ncbi:hypothetical protein RSOL_163420, partial [Rhizoctonia solani AG-3 Rhs1AP]
MSQFANSVAQVTIRFDVDKSHLHFALAKDIKKSFKVDDEKGKEYRGTLSYNDLADLVGNQLSQVEAGTEQKIKIIWTKDEKKTAEFISEEGVGQSVKSKSVAGKWEEVKA